MFKKVTSCYLKEDYVDKTDGKFTEFDKMTKDNQLNWEPFEMETLAQK